MKKIPEGWRNCPGCGKRIVWGSRNEKGEPIVEKSKLLSCFDCERRKRSRGK